MIMNILIIGYGSIGRRHKEILGSLYPDSKIDVVSLHADLDTTVYRSLDEVEGLSFYSYFIIASRTFEHYSQLVAIDSSVSGKIILVEKPLFHECTEYGSLRNRIYIGYNLRYNPQISLLKNLTSTHRFLTANVVVGQYLPSWRPGVDYRQSYSAFKHRGGGVLLDLSHEIDYVQWLFGRIVSLKAIGGKVSTLEIETDDIVSFIGQTELGVHLTVSLDYLSRFPIRRIYANAVDVSTVCDLVEGTARVYDLEGDVISSFPDTADRNRTYSLMHDDILHNEGATACSIHEGIEVMRTIKKIMRSMEKTDQ